jgi:hypothetical protein
MEVQFFHTAEQAAERLTEAVKAADGRVQYWQTQVKPGDCFMSDSGEGFPVFREVLEGYGENLLQHYRFCRCFSAACPRQSGRWAGSMGKQLVWRAIPRVDSRHCWEEA